jgi:pyruvate formate lyase activating enzyme
MISGWITNVERYTLHDGPGIRTTVFLKGCPLRCLWCSNPETQIQDQQLAYFIDRCSKCQRCVQRCPRKAIVSLGPDHPIEVNFNLCDNCGDCVSVCNQDALIMLGERVSAEEIAQRVERDLLFYQHSNGGVTLSGGDPLWQADFAGEILRLCQRRQIHTAIQSCAYAEKDQINKLLPFLDLAIIDLKHSNSATHKKITGKTNELILENIHTIDQQKVPIVIQIPLIPGFNDSDENLRNTFELARSLKHGMGVNLLTYHSLGVPKYKTIGRGYSLPDLEAPSAEYLQNKIEICKKYQVPIIQFMGDGILYS